MTTNRLTGYFFAASMLMIATENALADEVPANLTNVELEAGLLDSINEALPERVDVNQAYLDPSYDPTVVLQQDAQVSVTFLDEGAGYRNSLGYFTFDDSTFDGLTFGDIDTDSSGNISIGELSVLSGVDTGMIFNNVSETGGGGQLNAGDTYVLGDGSLTNIDGTDYDMTDGEVFEAGTQMGFFLLQNAWNGSEVNGWDNDLDPLTMYTIDFLNPENDASATIDNPDEYSRHVAMMFSDQAEDELILGFEDLKRPYGDNDFNDAVFRIRTDPIEAIYADVPDTDTVISLQAAPAPSLGASLPVMGLGLMLFNLLRRRAKEK